jgi:hypothetical protein
MVAQLEPRSEIVWITRADRTVIAVYSRYCGRKIG